MLKDYTVYLRIFTRTTPRHSFVKLLDFKGKRKKKLLGIETKGMCDLYDKHSEVIIKLVNTLCQTKVE